MAAISLEAVERPAGRQPLSVDGRRYHIALFALSIAINDARFRVIAPSERRLNLYPPREMPAEVRQPIIAVLHAFKPEVIDLVRQLGGAEANRGRLWAPSDWGPPQ